MPRTIAALAAAAFFAAACNENAPALPTTPQVPGVPNVVITVTSDMTTLNTGSQATITVTARVQGGSAVPDDTPVTLNTNLGSFGVDDSGGPQKLTTTPLVGGTATVKFFAGTETGTANVLAQLGTTVGRLNLVIKPVPAAPIADFSFDVQGTRAIFTDQSMGAPAKWSWAFGDSKKGTSDAPSPVYDYDAPGTYTVTLEVENDGGTNSKTKFVPVAAQPALVASFTSEINGLMVLFRDTSSGAATSWEWDFGDTTPKVSDRNPTHVYREAGTYAVTLKVSDGKSEATSREFVTAVALVADFTFQPSALRVVFTDISSGSPNKWAWDFGDNNKSDAQHPVHIYNAPGTYTVTLDARNSTSASQRSRFVTAVRPEVPRASFTTQVVGLDAAFTDTSSGTPTSWEWNFGDRTAVDKRQNPTHRYSIAGTYTVTLTVRNDAKDESSVSEIIKPVGAPIAAFTTAYGPQSTLVVRFIDQSTGGPTSWQWNFGDCALQSACTSVEQSPTHTYTTAGMYEAVLTVTNASGQSSHQRTVKAGIPHAAFTYQVAGRVVTFTDQSTGSPTSYNWSFGCTGCTSTEPNPVFEYPADGTYTVTLRVSNAAGESVSTPARITVTGTTSNNERSD